MEELYINGLKRSDFIMESNFTQGQMDAFAVENVETERKRIHGILSRVLVEENRDAIATGGLDDYLFSDYVETLQEILDKVILGNCK